MWLEEKRENQKFLSEEPSKAPSSWNLIGKKLKKTTTIVLIIILIVILVGGIFGIFYFRDLRAIYSLAKSGKERMEIAQNFLLEKDFAPAADEFQISQNNFIEAENELSKLKLLKLIPVINKQVLTAENLLTAGINLADGMKRLSLLGEDISSTINVKSLNYLELSAPERREIFRKLSEAEPLFEEVKDDIDRAVVAIGEIPEYGLFGSLKQVVDPLREKLPQVKDFLDKFLPMLRVLPEIAGYPVEKTYLFLIQNNSELRPTGGFIGTYGILKLKDGEITYFRTDNIYNLDGPSEKFLKIETPWQIQKYLSIKYWFMRDSNWSPDFPTSAEKALWFYHEERGKEQGIDGVIAITPEFIRWLLGLTGPIKVEDIIFTSENLVDALENRVGKEYYRLGIKESERKEIIGKLANDIKLKLFSLPPSQWKAVVDILDRALNEKQALLYVKDKDLESLILERNWGGALRYSPDDYLMVVDANLSALKSDQVVERKIRYEVRAEGSDLLAKVSINYIHQGRFTWKTTRLRTYARVYVPDGSQLIKGQGMLENDKLIEPSGKPGQIEVGRELGKTYFGAFISIEPGEERTLSFEYKLPVRIGEEANQGGYSLIIQKQPGTIGHGLTLDLEFDKNIKSAQPAEEMKEWGDNIYKLNTDLRVDREIRAGF
jgi:hypothetical protein